jgi:hypothetical protein
MTERGDPGDWADGPPGYEVTPGDEDRFTVPIWPMMALGIATVLFGLAVLA